MNYKTAVAFVVYLLCFHLVTNVASSEPSIMHFYFSNQRNVSLASNTNYVLESRSVRFDQMCAVHCSHQLSCLAYFTERSISDRKLWACTLFTNTQPEDNFISGQGVYGVLKRFNLPSDIASTVATVPDLSPAVFTKITRSPSGVSALYDCNNTANTVAGTNIGLLYDMRTNSWPTISAACRTNICDHIGMTDVLMRIEQRPTNSKAYIICPENEVHQSDGSCDENGEWSLATELGVACLPSSCYRKDVLNKPVYGGHVSKSRNNITCQNWVSLSPRWHVFNNGEYFPEDGKDVTAARNYCRDPEDKTNLPWCYQMTGERWAHCDVPLCRLDFPSTGI